MSWVSLVSTMWLGKSTRAVMLADSKVGCRFSPMFTLSLSWILFAGFGRYSLFVLVIWLLRRRLQYSGHLKNSRVANFGSKSNGWSIRSIRWYSWRINHHFHTIYFDVLINTSERWKSQNLRQFFMHYIENYNSPLVERTPTMRSSILVAVSRALAMPLKIASAIWWRFEP